MRAAPRGAACNRTMRVCTAHGILSRRLFFEEIKKLLLFRLVALLGGLVELPQKLLLLARQARRRLDDDRHKLVAAASLVVDERNALAAQAEGRAGLRALGGVFVSFGTKISAGKVLKSGKGYAFFGV